jgi:hypothetical protein
MLGEITNDFHSDNENQAVKQVLPHLNSRKMYHIPNMYQDHFKGPTPRIHHFRQLKIALTILLSLFSTLYLTQKRARRTESLMIVNSMKVIKQNVYDDDDDDTNKKEPNLIYRCPITKRVDDDKSLEAPIEHKVWYDSAGAKITNINSYMETFRLVDFDNWGHTYNEVKHGMYSWKSRYFTDLKSNDVIYESACGIGMNLYMTLEILQQISGITNVTIYGNDYVRRSVQIAQEIYKNTGKSNRLLPLSFGQLGSICEADSTQLDFVPSNTFDLVYTGYISPLFDPLHLNQSTTNENFVQYNAYCEQQQHRGRIGTKINQSSSPTLAEKAQQLQNDWYGKWVGEMIRIAKPGAPIIVEQVSYPYV